MIASSPSREILTWSSRAMRGFFFLGMAVAFHFTSSSSRQPLRLTCLAVRPIVPSRQYGQHVEGQNSW